MTIDHFPLFRLYCTKMDFLKEQCRKSTLRNGIKTVFDQQAIELLDTMAKSAKSHPEYNLTQYNCSSWVADMLTQVGIAMVSNGDNGQDARMISTPGDIFRSLKAHDGFTDIDAKNVITPPH